MNLLTATDAAVLAERHWHVRGQMDALPSYIDQNFRIRADDGDYVLKIAHPSWQRDDLDLENEAMLALAKYAPRIAWPKVFFTPDGEHLLSVPLYGETRFVRLLGFVPGTTWADAIEAVPAGRRAALHHSLGEIVAQLDRGLSTFHHPRAGRPHPWNLARLPELTDEVGAIADVELRERVSAGTATFVTALPGWRATLPTIVAHNDANDRNVLVARHGEAWTVDSILDFGDMCTTFRIAELAIACTYAMQHEDEMLSCVHNIVRGYVSINPLTAGEIGALHAFLVARACQSILMAARGSREQPDNAYIAVSQHGMRRVLDELACITPAEIAEPFVPLDHV